MTRIISPVPSTNYPSDEAFLAYAATHSPNDPYWGDLNNPNTQVFGWYANEITSFVSFVSGLTGNYGAYFTLADFMATNPPISQQVQRSYTTNHYVYGAVDPITNTTPVTTVSTIWHFYMRFD